jgi:hypothetical protein
MDSLEDELEAYLARNRHPEGPLPAPREVFDVWRSPREGNDNPTRMDNPVWAWLVRNRISAYAAVDAYGAPGGYMQGPTWCFDRFGQTETQLPDGRVLYVGGEHEDHYDPDFHIYNDVVVIHPSGEVSILGYPKSVFPPTDFHTATLVGSDLYLVGRLGYPEDRRQRIESVHVLDTGSYRIRTMQTSGEAPPWLHRHVAELDADGGRILLRGGKVLHDELPVMIDNLDQWALRIHDGAWTRIEHCVWPRWCLTREEPRANALWAIRQLLWTRSVGWVESESEQRAQLESLLGSDAEPDSIETLYSPPIAHQKTLRDEDEEDSYRIWRILVEHVVVRYDEGMSGVIMTIEGELPDSVSTILVEDLRKKLSAVEGCPYHVLPIRIE